MSTTACNCKLRQTVLTALALAACQWLVACASLNTGTQGPPFRDPGLSMQSAQNTVVAGQTTQADVMATLGPATEIRFDSGYALWVYRAQAAEPGGDRAEFAILFAPSGVVKKTRLRPAYAAMGK